MPDAVCFLESWLVPCEACLIPAAIGPLPCTMLSSDSAWQWVRQQWLHAPSAATSQARPSVSVLFFWEDTDIQWERHAEGSRAEGVAELGCPLILPLRFFLLLPQ